MYNQFTINHIHSKMITRSHYTSTKFQKHESEFDKCKLTPEYLNRLKAPYVKESYIKIGLDLEDIHLIKSNGCRLIIGKIKHIFMPHNAIQKDGNIQLELLDSVGVNGLYTYYSLNKIAESTDFIKLESCKFCLTEEAKSNVSEKVEKDGYSMLQI